jgi:hypothetical protein
MNNGGDAVQTDWVTTPSDLLVRYDVVNIAVLGERMDTKQILIDLRAGRKKIAEAQRKRWAAVKKAAAKTA